MTGLALVIGAVVLLPFGWLARGRRRTAFLTGAAALLCASACFEAAWWFAVSAAMLAAAGAGILAGETAEMRRGRT